MITTALENDIDSKLGAYYEVKPQITQPNYAKMNLHEIERILLTRYRTGSHNLRIETGRQIQLHHVKIQYVNADMMFKH